MCTTGVRLSMYLYGLCVHIPVNPSGAKGLDMKLGAILLMALPALFSGGALAADNAASVNKPVRVQVTGITAGAVPGKLIAVEGCLYVRFDQRTKDGFTSVRLDQVTSLQILAAESNPSLEAMLRQEPRKCFEEANG